MTVSNAPCKQKSFLHFLLALRHSSVLRLGGIGITLFDAPVKISDKVLRLDNNCHNPEPTPLIDIPNFKISGRLAVQYNFNHGGLDERK